MAMLLVVGIKRIH